MHQRMPDLPKNRVQLASKLKEVEERKLIKFLSNMAAFNKLDNRIVNLVSESFFVDAKSLCKNNGIVYWIR